MKIGIHSNQFDGRGTGKVPLDYGLGLRNLLGHEVVFITSGLSANEGLARISKEFETFTYDKKVGVNTGEEVNQALSNIIEREGIDFIHLLKAGNDDGVAPKNCKTGVHCIFDMKFKHGDIYAGVSDYLAKKFGQSAFVPHIIKNYSPSEDFRDKHNIPKNALVFGRHGGPSKFDLPFAHLAVAKILELRKDVWFAFLSTDKFIEHPRAIFIPWVSSEQDTFNFIHGCDAMIHARSDGETFGLACGEFSAANKPVITWSGGDYQHYDKAHIDQLQGRALLYNDQYDLFEYFKQLTREYILDNDWDTYTEVFSEKNVTDQYNKTFLLP